MTNKFFYPRRPGLRRPTPSSSSLVTTERRATGSLTTAAIITNSTIQSTTAHPKSLRTTIARRKFLSPRTTTAKSQVSKTTTSTEKPTTRHFVRKPFRKFATTSQSTPYHVDIDVDQKMDASIQQSQKKIPKEGQQAELIAVAQAVNKLQQVPPPNNRMSHLKITHNNVNRAQNGFSKELPSSTSSSTPTKPTTRFAASDSQLKTVVETTKYENILGNIPKHAKVILYSDGSINCLDQGNFPHPTSCKKFISCALMHNGEIRGWQYSCPKNLSFDPIGGMCNWSMGLDCDER